MLCCGVDDHSWTVVCIVSRRRIDYWGVVSYHAKGHTLYLRRLSTNEAHPIAHKPELHLASEPSGINVRLQPVTMLVYITGSSRIVVWN